jgi:hypothetical protein
MVNGECQHFTCISCMSRCSLMELHVALSRKNIKILFISYDGNKKNLSDRKTKSSTRTTQRPLSTKRSLYHTWDICHLYLGYSCFVWINSIFHTQLCCRKWQGQVQVSSRVRVRLRQKKCLLWGFTCCIIKRSIGTRSSGVHLKYIFISVTCRVCKL